MLIAVLDTETTGLPPLAAQGLFHLVELGAVVVDTTTCEIRHAEPFRALVRVEDGILDHPATQIALSLAGPDLKQEIREWGQPLDRVQVAWAAWTARHFVEGVAAFNYTFDKGAAPWIDQPWMRCLMHWGLALIKERDPTYAPLQHPKFGIKQPKASEMAAWLRQQGYRIPEAFPEHRALPDAQREAHFLAAYLEMDPSGLRRA